MHIKVALWGLQCRHVGKVLFARQKSLLCLDVKHGTLLGVWQAVAGTFQAGSECRGEKACAVISEVGMGGEEKRKLIVAYDAHRHLDCIHAARVVVAPSNGPTFQRVQESAVVRFACDAVGGEGSRTESVYLRYSSRSREILYVY